MFKIIGQTLALLHVLIQYDPNWCACIKVASGPIIAFQHDVHNFSKEISIVCQSQGPPSPQSLFLTHGLKACQLSTTSPGTYHITFTVTNSRGVTASMARRLVVQECLLNAGETPCALLLSSAMGSIMGSVGCSVGEILL